MITIKLFGTLRLRTGFKEMQLYASDIEEVCLLLARVTGWGIKEFKACSFFLNGKEVKRSAKLKEGDEVVLLSPPKGGNYNKEIPNVT